MTIYDNIGSSNGLLPADTKPLPEPMLTDPRQGFVAFAWENYMRSALNVNL